MEVKKMSQADNPSEVTIESLQARIEALEAALERIEALEASLANQKKIIVEATRDAVHEYIHGMFKNEVFLDSLAAQIVNRLQNALLFKAQHSEQRVPELICTEIYVPGCQRISIDEAGVVTLESQEPNATQPSDAWARSDVFDQHPDALEPLRDLALSYGLTAEKSMYVMDDISLKEYRKGVLAKIKASELQAAEHNNPHNVTADQVGAEAPAEDLTAGEPIFIA